MSNKISSSPRGARICKSRLEMPGIAGEKRLFKKGEFSPGGRQRIWGTKALGKDAIEFFTDWAPPLRETIILSSRYPDRPVQIFWREDGIFKMYGIRGGMPELCFCLDPGPAEDEADIDDVTGQGLAAIHSGSIAPGSAATFISRSGAARLDILLG